LNSYNVDLSRVLAKPLYLGLLINIFFPAIILGIAYYLGKGEPLEPKMPTEQLNIIFWALMAVAISDGAIAYFLKRKRFFVPMIRYKATFESDFSQGVFRASILGFAITAAIPIYGVVFYFLGGSFEHLFLFIIISFIVFQLIRPRFGFLEKVLAAQEKFVAEGRFLIEGPRFPAQ
jgi:hypothetical protein